jgi:hypothetical protein
MMVFAPCRTTRGDRRHSRKTRVVPRKLRACLALVGLLALAGCSISVGAGENVRITGGWDGDNGEDDDES